MLPTDPLPIAMVPKFTADYTWAAILFLFVVNGVSTNRSLSSSSVATVAATVMEKCKYLNAIVERKHDHSMHRR